MKTLNYKFLPHTIAIHESKECDKVISFATGVYELLKHTNLRYAKRITAAANTGNLYGVYLTKSGRLKAKFIL